MLDRLGGRIAAALLKLHQRSPLALEFPRTQLASPFDYIEPAIFDAALQTLAESHRVRLTNTTVALVGQGPQLSQNERRLLAQLIEQLRLAGLEAPFVKELAQSATHNRECVRSFWPLRHRRENLLR